MIARRLHPLLIVTLAVLAWLALPVMARAQSEPVTVHINAPKQAYVGDPFDVQVLIRGSRNVPAPSIPASADYTVTYRGPLDRSSSTTIIINGKVRHEGTIGFAHIFSLTAARPGEIVIPPLTVTVDGRPFTTDEVRIRTLEPAQTADFRLDFVPEKLRAFAGEPVLVRLTWLLGKPVKNFDISLPTLPDGCELLPGPDPRPPGTHPRDPRFVELRFGDDTAIAVTSQAELNGRTVDAVTIERVLIARDPGRVAFGPARVDFGAVIGERPRRLMDNPFEDYRIIDRQAATSKPFEIEVLPLPEDGRPADFSGLVGAYSVVASADPRDVSVGEPITLRVTINGPPPLSLIPILDLNSQPAIAAQFRVPRDPGLPVQTPVGAMFSSTIRARSPEQKQIPPIELSYFDTRTGKYAVARSEPIYINVRPAVGVSLPEIEDEEAASVAAKRSPSSRVDAAPLELSGRRFRLAEAARSPLTLAAVALPPLAVLGTWVGADVHRRRKADPARLRRRRAVRAAHRRLRRLSQAEPPAGASAAEVSRILTDLAADWFDRAPGSLTSPEAVRLLSSAAESGAGSLARLLAECDRARFSGEATGSPPTDLLARARGALTEIGAGLEARA